MTDSFVTQCPHCQTSFRVTHHQLSVARGVVRCGACLQVFNAARQLLEQSRGAETQADGSPLPAITTPEMAKQAPELAPVPLPPSPPGERVALAEQDWAVTQQSLEHLDLDEELARLERRGTTVEHEAELRDERLHARRDDPGGDEHPDIGTAFGSGDNASIASAEAQLPAEPAPPLIEQGPLELEPVPGDRTEPTFNLEPDPEPHDEPALRHVGILDEDTAARDDPDLDERFSQTRPGASAERFSALDDDTRAERLSARDDDEDHPADERMEPSLAARPERSARKEPLIDVVDDPLQLDWQKPRPDWSKRLLWGVLALFAAGLLAFQYVWFHFDELARQDQYRPWFQQLCPTLGCKVPSRVDIGRIKSSNLVVRSHPDFKGALIVDAIIYNRAPFAQPFPLLEIRFSDLNGQLIASRRFKPSEYLSGELAGRGDMPSQTPIHIALDILDPGPRAVNYSLSFRSPE
ncbi:DUF3426 domain-containing protein [Pseudomonas capeferrum]|uniref:DUF3426 domain-containing protein n=1 Tax=Pseudomonas capeferrum TaxID=1495066 RepID=UPI0015E482EC|nr:DUF3426 domain-containing protein [Pseudomonas capeferrum]MBA1205097.1 DUF3426 domain-containing protein [Pseudomonas capeferrum]